MKFSFPIGMKDRIYPVPATSAIYFTTIIIMAGMQQVVGGQNLTAV